MNYSCVCLILTIIVGLIATQSHRVDGAQPAVYYANVGNTATMTCTAGGGSYACFASYAFQNQVFKMVYLNSSAKYQVMPGSIAVTNVQPTDAGFYACSNDCNQMKLDQISYYLQPMCKLPWKKVECINKATFIFISIIKHKVNRQTWANSF